MTCINIIAKKKPFIMSDVTSILKLKYDDILNSQHFFTNMFNNHLLLYLKPYIKYCTINYNLRIYKLLLYPNKEENPSSEFKST